MRSIIVEIPLLGKSGDIVERQFLEAFDDGSNVTLKFGEGPLDRNVFLGVDYFWELGAARSQMEKMGFMPACKGAIKFVFPGGLQGETSLGLVAYVFNEQGETTGQVNIFDKVDPQDFHNIVSFEKQKEYRKSLRGKRERFPRK